MAHTVLTRAQLSRIAPPKIEGARCYEHPPTFVTGSVLGTAHSSLG
jgi:hypothetical protein